MKLKNKNNEQFVDYFFKNHKVFVCDDLPWKLFNFENSKAQKENNYHTRIEYLFSKNGFFNETYKERNPEYIIQERRKHLDYCFYHRQRRYIVQELVDNNFHNPTHHSFILKSGKQIDFDNLKFDEEFQMVTHPGHTRFESSCFLKKNLDKAFIYVNKDEYYDGYFKQNFLEIKNIEEAYKYWEPSIKTDRKNLLFDFLSPRYFHMEERGFKNGTKYHKQTKCNILKLWELNDISTINKSIGKIKGDNLLHTQSYIDKFFDSSDEIADIMFEKKLTIYTNSNKDVKLYFENLRNKLINYAKGIMKKRNNKYYFDNLKYFDFDVVVVDKKPSDISKLNQDKGFAIWIDKDILFDIKREIYEFTFFTRKNIKLAETLDGKISVVNCRYRGNEKWNINKEFYL